MIDLAATVATELGARFTFQCTDLTRIGQFVPFDCIFSNGVLEHFDDTSLREILGIQLRSSRRVVIAVPSDYFLPEEAINGDERFMDAPAWRARIEGAGGQILESFTFGPRAAEKSAYLGFVVTRRPSPRREARFGRRLLSDTAVDPS